MDIDKREFSDQDIKILKLLKDSATNSMIATELGVEKKKVTQILKDLYRKLNCDYRANPRNVAACYAVVLNL